jgi:hypothetical protein
MPIRESSLFATQRQVLLAAVRSVALIGIVGCSDALRAGSRGTDGATATGGGAGSQGDAAAGGATETGGCPEVGHEYCVETCFADHALSDDPWCSKGAWVCRSGWVLASTCPAQACRVTPSSCCDSTTGLVSENPCARDGYRAPCPDGNIETYSFPSAWCVPQGLGVAGCASLRGQPCTGPAVGCSDMSGGSVTCWCGQYGTDASTGIWDCSFFLGP